MKQHRLGYCIAAFAAAMIAVGAFGAAEWRNGERQPLWPEGKTPDFQEHQVGAMTDEAKEPGFRPEEHRMPYLEWFAKPAKPNGGTTATPRRSAVAGSAVATVSSTPGTDPFSIFTTQAMIASSPMLSHPSGMPPRRIFIAPLRARS